MWTSFNATSDYIRIDDEEYEYVRVGDISIVGIRRDGWIEEERCDDPGIEIAWAVILLHVIGNPQTADELTYIIDSDVTKYAAGMYVYYPITDCGKLRLAEVREPWQALSEKDRQIIAEAIARFARRACR